MHCIATELMNILLEAPLFQNVVSNLIFLLDPYICIVGTLACKDDTGVYSCGGKPLHVFDNVFFIFPIT